MNRRPFIRKIVYLSIIAVLLIPLSWLAVPATVATDDTQGSSGGQLSTLRDEHGLSQANLGEIDPSGEAIKLATLGMTGVAANVLWTKANEYALKEDWNSLSATLEQITKLQPNFVAVWRYQGWNLSYNVSVEWDDYQDRYYWVMRGIDFLDDGIRYNQNDVRLRWDVGRYIGHKLGRSDERVEFRKLFREDDDFHGDRPYNERDNWLVGKESFYDAQEMVDTRGARLRGLNPFLFHAYPPLWQINYAAALEEDGTFGERARLAWDTASNEWDDFGQREFNSRDGRNVRLSELPLHLEKVQSLNAQTNELIADVRAEISAEREARLTDEQKQLLKTPLAQLTLPEKGTRSTIERSLDPPLEEILARISDGDREKVQKLADEMADYSARVRYIRSGHQSTNYEYWTIRVAAERMPEAVAAHEALYEGDEFFTNADLERAREKYEEGLKLWRVVLDKHPELVADGITGELLTERIIYDYQAILRQLDEPFPEDFILQDLLDVHAQNILPRPARGR